MDDPTATVPLHGGEPPRQGPPGSEVLDRGAAVGRYVILDRIGAGGMGVVYAAYDPELDRRVALKLLRSDRFTSESGRLRLLREAQALARLTHPNVVAVYDAGTFGDRVFVAMELVEGETLRQWLRAGERSWREVLDHLVPAGRGLAAAHAAGLVHRDFKPENVLLGKDGRVRVVDFGLAKALADAAGEPPGEGAETESSGALATPLTEWGVLLGTPAYMAPEQLRGIVADERSDQFSFCVTLYEALYGERPFAGTNPREIAEAVTRGGVREAPAGTKVPGWLRAVVLRGLKVSPEERYGVMDDLLRALERDPAAVHRRWLAAAVVVLLMGAIFSSLGYFQARRARLCGGGEEKLAGVWDAERKQAIHAAFAASGAPGAEAAWKIVEAGLDRYTRDWGRMRRQACEATRIRGEQSEELLDRRMFCLDQRLQDTAALAGVFSRADRQIVERSVPAVYNLPEIATCADTEALTAKLPPPRDPRLRAQVERARGQVAEARALTSAGKAKEALPKAQAAAEQALRLGYLPLKAEALYQKGYDQNVTGDPRNAEETLFAALVAAQSSGHQEMAAQAASQLGWVVGWIEARPAEGLRWAHLAEAIAEGAKGGDVLRSDLFHQLGSVLANEGRFAEAADVARRSLALAERSLGPEHPKLAPILTNLGEYYNQMGRFDEALLAVQRGLAIRTKTLSPDHPDFGRSYTTLGNIYTSLHRDRAAAEQLERALAVYRRHYGPHHWLTAGALGNLGVIYQRLGRLPQALRYDRETLAAFEALNGPEHPNVARALVNLGEALRLAGQPAESLANYQRAREIQEKALGSDNPDLAFSLVGVSQSLLALGRAAEAVAPAERAVALREGKPLDPAPLHQTRFILAQALWEGHGDRARALRLARQAREGLAAAGDADAQREVEAWLRQRGPTG